jgi:hypothetical protein
MTNNIPVDVPDLLREIIQGIIAPDSPGNISQFLPDLVRRTHSLIPEINFKDKLLWHNLHSPYPCIRYHSSGYFHLFKFPPGVFGIVL